MHQILSSERKVLRRDGLTLLDPPPPPSARTRFYVASPPRRRRRRRARWVTERREQSVRECGVLQCVCVCVLFAAPCADSLVGCITGFII